MKRIVTFLLLLVCSKPLISQTVPAPVPCTSPPNGPGCLCSTAGLLCTPDLLDGFTFTMSNSFNQGGISSNDLCPGINNQDGVPNNVNWFSFIAWCTDLNLDLHISNCQPGTQNNPNNPSYGVQVGLFASCSSGSSGWNPVECFTEPGPACSNNPNGYNTLLNFNVTGLVIGNVYYFLLDGCAGSACDIMVDVIGTCGTGVIDPWTTGITGPDTTCVGNTETYTAEDLDGAVQYYYYLDGALIASGDELYSTDITWTTPGTYQLCVDVANLPCIPESDPPAPACMDIVVCPAADAGIINATPNPACPGETINITISGNEPSNTNYVVITDSNGDIVQVVTGNTATFTHDACDDFIVYSYNAKVGAPAPMVGMEFLPNFPCDDNCCDIEELMISFEDTNPPVFTNPPPSVDYDCLLDLPPMVDLDYTDDCVASGLVSGSESGSVDLCNGGMLVRTWVVEDSCANSTLHRQDITVGPYPLGAFVNPPGDETIQCDAIPTTAPDLNVTNGGMSGCLLDEMVSPTTTGSATKCGGTITNTWSITDTCGRLIEHVQNITVEPAPEPLFINPPADITVQCDAIPTSAPDLTYDNGETGFCQIIGTESPIQSGSGDICGGNISFTWEYVDTCGRTITHVQTITIDPVPLAAFVNPPADVTVSCANIPPPAADMSYTNGESGVCEIMGTVSPMIVDNSSPCGGNIVNVWEFVDQCGRTISHTQTITIQPATLPAFVNPPADVTVACDAIPTTAPDLTITNGESGTCLIESTVSPTQIGTPNPCGGSFQFRWTFLDPCNRTVVHTQTITITPAPIATFATPPVEVSVDCDAIPGTPGLLAYDNGATGVCAISGSVNPTRIGNVGACGGTLQDVWSFTDNCGRNIQEVRNINVGPAPQANWTSTPADITIECTDVQNINSSLAYDNGLAPPCRIQGSVNAFNIENYTECGGTILQTWTFTDECNRTITANRTITVNPAPEPTFVSPPADITLDCDVVYNPPQVNFSNGLNGDCEIMGTATVSTTWNVNIMINEYSFTSPCSGQLYTHTQQVTTIISPDLELSPNFVEGCIGQTFDLSTLDVIDNNLTNPTYTYHLSLPPSNFNEVGPIIEFVGSFTYYIYGLNSDGCDDAIPVYVYAEEPINAGEDNEVDLCKDGNTIDVTTYLSPDASSQGYWADLDFTGIDLNNPIAVNINNIAPGTYAIYYITNSTQSCPGDTAVMTLNIADDVVLSVSNVECSSDNTSYSLTVTKSINSTVTTSLGTTNVINNTTVEVVNIPIGNPVIITATSTTNSCSKTRTVNPPNCDCPDIDPPTGTPQYKICEGNAPLTMSVSVGAGLSANWYDSEASTTPLAEKTLSYNHTANSPGLYNYYVEAIDTTTNCISQNRLQIVVEVVRNPIVNSINPKVCDDNFDGFVAFDLIALQSQINNNPANTITFHLTNADAVANSNPLVSPYVNTSPNQIIFARVTNPTGCFSMAQVTLTVLPKPTFDVSILNESCLGSSDGEIEISNVQGNPPFVTRLNNRPFISDLNYDSLNVGTYTVTVRDTFLCQNRDTVDVSQGLRISLPTFSIMCDNKGTLTDASDDEYVVAYRVESNIPLTTQVRIFVNGTEVNLASYNENGQLFLPANSQIDTLVFLDTERGCPIQRIVGPLNPCSTTCEISIDDLQANCSDNNTPNDPSDDVYNVSITASSINGAANNMYLVYVNGTLRGAATYGMPFSFNINADGNNATILLQDSEDPQCQLSRELPNLDPCSDGCLVDLKIVSSVCNNNGTILDKTDDFYEITVRATSVNTGSISYDLSIDGTVDQSLNYGEDILLILPADGMTHSLRAIDQARPQECFDEAVTAALINCSTDCEVIVESSNIQCNNNGTNQTNNDDTFTFSVRVTGGKGNGWTLADGSANGSYGSNSNFGPYPISGGPIVLNFIDNDIADCNTEITINPPQPCSNCSQTMSLMAGGIIDCQNPEVSLTASVSEVGTYRWTFNGGLVANTLTASAGTGGMYVFEVIFADGCSLIDSILVDSDDDIPVARGGLDKVLTCVVDTVLLDGSGSSTGSSITYEWTDAQGNVISNNVVLIVTEPGDYFLQVIDNSNNCKSAKDRVVVTEFIDIPSTAIYANPADQFDCIIAEILLTTDKEANVRYDWITPEGVFNNLDSLLISQLGTYILIATNTLSECVDTGKIEILSFQEYPIIILEADGVLDCDVNSVSIDGSASQSNANINSTWYNESGEVIATNTYFFDAINPGLYILELIDDENGCTNRDSINIEKLENDVEIEIDPVIEVIEGETVILRPRINIPEEEIDSIIWTPSIGLSCDDCLEPTVTVSSDITYNVTIIDIYGCEATASISLRAKIKTVITAPNVIYPGSQGGNDKFVISADDEDAVLDEVLIYDRWGNKVYSSSTVIFNSSEGAWDGTFDGKLAASGVYVYMVKATLGNGESIVLKGDLTVLH